MSDRMASSRVAAAGALGPAARMCCCGGRRPGGRRWPWGWPLPRAPGGGALLPALVVVFSLLLPLPSHSTALGEEDGVAEAPPPPSLPPTVIRTRVINTKYGRLQGFVSHASGAHGAIPASTSPASQDSEGGTRHRKPVDVFLGIPYATPPVRSNRFGPTRTPVPWDGLRPADRLSPVCPQHFPDEVLAVSRALEASSPAASAAAEAEALRRMPRGRLESLKRLLPHLRRQSEDCLYLNVYAPAQVAPPEALERYPVLVFVHGESFSWNSGNPYDGSILASYADLVVVTLNYRLGVLGFLNANAAPHLRARVANYGLMDQIAALHWIQNNIALFGGDPTNVTLFGHGTGAACVNLLMVSPTVMPGLFHRAALLSGSALSSWAIVEDPVFYAVRLARRLNCSSPEDAAPTATGAAPSGAAAAAEAWREAERLEDCLRAAPLSALTAQDAPPPPPAFLTAFGPSVDGVVVRPGFRADMAAALLASGGGGGGGGGDGDSGGNGKKRSSGGGGGGGAAGFGLNTYDLLFGVVSGEALFRFSNRDVQSGFEGERRDRIVRTYVRNAYRYHLSEIFFTVVNEYTDWERTVQHPINTRDATVAALSDAQFVAPLVQAGDALAARPGARSFFYVFDYQTRDGDYPQRMGTVHGEDLPYIFGAPLVEGGFNHFPRNYTKAEAALSEAVMIYWSNFARTGNPNEHLPKADGSGDRGSRERNRFKNIVWEEYDSVHQKYLEIGMKPRIKNHFRAHQLSVWLRLIPELHRAGMEDAAARHNLFRNHDDPSLYDGPLRADSGSPPLPDLPEAISSPSPEESAPRGPTTTCASVPAAAAAATPPSAAAAVNQSDALASLEAAAGFAAYSTALSVTIAIGCSLLILNVLIFAGVYYQRDKHRLEAKHLQQQRDFGSSSGGGTLDKRGACGDSGSSLDETATSMVGTPSAAATAASPLRGKAAFLEMGVQGAPLRAPPPSPAGIPPPILPPHLAHHRLIHGHGQQHISAASSPPNGSAALHLSVPLNHPPVPAPGPPPSAMTNLHPGSHGPHQPNNLAALPGGGMGGVGVVGVVTSQPPAESQPLLPHGVPAPPRVRVPPQGVGEMRV